MRQNERKVDRNEGEGEDTGVNESRKAFLKKLSCSPTSSASFLTSSWTINVCYSLYSLISVISVISAMSFQRCKVIVHWPKASCFIEGFKGLIVYVEMSLTVLFQNCED